MEEVENMGRSPNCQGLGEDAPGGINDTSNGHIRRYLVLLQDCLAIKFVSIAHLEEKRNQRVLNSIKRATAEQYEGQRECQCDKVNQLSSHQTVKCGTSNTSSSGGVTPSVNRKLCKSPINKNECGAVGNGSHCNGRCSCENGEWEGDQTKQNFLGRKQHHCPNCLASSQPIENGSSHALKDECVYTGRENICRAPKASPQEGATTHTNGSNLSMLTKVDHSMQALFLYKEFLDINLNCYWNSAVCEAIKHLEFKGSIVPSTIIVNSPIRKHLNILKTAWSRKMLRSPSGYLIDFLGEIEELIADPIAKSHFVPLSDSLCWAIHELTSSGKEAFVDDIFLSLLSAFPGTALPTKELIYQTLEKLTREKKIYQTAQGYFVVTPDTHRYITSTEPLLFQSSINDSQINATAANFLRSALFLQESANHCTTPSKQFEGAATEEGKEDLESQRESQTAPSPDPDTYSLPYGTFRRYNSLRIKKSSGSGTSTGCLPRRTLSMRLPKSKSKNGSKSAISVVGGDQMGKSRADVTDSFQNLDSAQSSATVNEQLLSRRRKHKSFLSRLLSFRGVRKSGGAGRKDRAGRNSGGTKTQTTARNDKSSKSLICSKDGDNAGSKNNDDLSEAIVPGDVKGKLANRKDNLATISTQTSFSIENLNGDLTLLSLTPQPRSNSKSSTLERDDSDSGRCTDSHSDADAEITAALSRGLSPIISRHHHHIPDRKRDASHNCNVYEKIESDLGLKVDVDECDGRSPRSPSSQTSVSPSPSAFTTGSTAFCKGNSLSRHHHPHNIYNRCNSSASSSNNSYRDFYNLYRRRHPCYYPQSTATSPESVELGEGTKLKSPLLQHMRYPPRSFERRQIFDEISRSSFKEKKYRGPKTVTVTSSNTPEDNEKVTRAGQHDITERIVFGSEKNSAVTTPTSTILTQTVKNTTNLELEFRLPLGNIFSAAMGGGSGPHVTSRMNMSATSPSPPSSVKFSSGQPFSNESGCKENEVGRGQECKSTPSTSTSFSEVNMMVNDLFTINSFVKSNQMSDELSSTIKLKTNGSSNFSNNAKTSIRNCSGTTSNDKTNHKEKQRFLIETVSSKPFTDIHTNFNRESEII